MRFLKKDGMGCTCVCRLTVHHTQLNCGADCVEYLCAEMLRDILEFAKYELIIKRNTPCSTENPVLCCASVTTPKQFEFL